MPIKLGKNTTLAHDDVEGNLLEISDIGETRDKIDATHMESVDIVEYIADALKELSDIKATMQITAGLPVSNQTPSNLVIVLPAETPITLTAPAFVTEWRHSPQRKEVMTYEVTFCLTGPLVRT